MTIGGARFVVGRIILDLTDLGWNYGYAICMVLGSPGWNYAGCPKPSAWFWVVLARIMQDAL